MAVAVLLLPGCGAHRGGGGSPSATPRLPVLTTAAPITLFTRAVAGDCAEVTSLLPPGSGPHGFQSRPQDLLALRRARVLVINGLGLESFLEPLLRSAAPSGLTVIDSSRAVDTLDAARPSLASVGGGDELHAQGPGQEEPHDNGHAHGDGHDHGANGVNPHIWLDPLKAVQQVETIRDGLIAADPACAAGYRRRAAAYTTQLRRLDADLARQLKPLRGRTFVVFHDFAPYFAARYGLRAEYLVQSPERAAAPADLQRVAEAVRNSGIRVLLSPAADGSRVFTNLARDLGVRVAPFASMEILNQAELADPDSYAVLLRRNAAALRQAFSP